MSQPLWVRWIPVSIPRRPATAPDFLLSRATGSIRTQGTRTTFPDAFEAATALRNGDVDLVVGAVPFDTSLRAALVEPERVITSEGPLEPRRSSAAARSPNNSRSPTSRR